MKFKKSLLFFLALFIMAGSSGAFTEGTQKLILRDVVCFCPPELKVYLMSNKKAVKEGAGFVDRRGKTIKLSWEEVLSVYNYIVKHLETESLQDDYYTGKMFGMLASFVSSAINPARKIRAAQPQAVQPKLIIYDGHQKIDEEYLQALMVTPVKTSEAYNKAVNSILDVWISAWQDGGRRASKFYARGTKKEYTNKSLGAMSASARLRGAEREKLEKEAAEQAAAEKKLRVIIREELKRSQVQ